MNDESAASIHNIWCLMERRLGVVLMSQGVDSGNRGLSEVRGITEGVAVLRGELEEGRRLRGNIKRSKVPEHASITILELDIMASGYIRPIGKAVDARPVVAAEERGEREKKRGGRRRRKKKGLGEHWLWG